MKRILLIAAFLFSAIARSQSVTGTHVQATSVLQAPVSTSTASSISGSVAIDTNGDGSNVTQGVLSFYDGTRLMYGIFVDSLPSVDDYVLAYDSAAKKFVFQAQTGGSGVSDGDKGDITVSSSGAAWDIDNSAVTYAKIQNVSATSKLLGRNSSTTGPPEEITLGSGLSMSGTTLSATGSGSGDALVANPLSQFAATTSLQLAGVISDETGSGALVFGTSPTLTTPTLGVASATTINKVALTSPATGSTLTIADGKTLTANNTVTLSGTDGSTITFGSGGTVAYTANNLSAFSSTTSAQLAGVLSNESGTGLSVFNDGATITNATINGIDIRGTAGSTLNVGTGGTIGTAAYTASSAYQATDAEITALAGLTSAADKVPYFTGIGTATTADFTSTGRTLVSQASAKAVFDAINGAEATVASATTTDIGAASSDKVSITGTTTITGFGTATAGIQRKGRFTGALTLTHNATSLILPGGANITTVAGDRFEAVSLGSGNWVVYNYTTATRQGSGAQVFATSPTLTTPVLGVATATSVNKVAITAPATSATLTIADGKTATVNNSITFAGTDSTTMTFPSVSASIGYLGIPQGSKSADYTLVLADAGTHIFHPSSDANSRTFTIPANGSVAFPVGTAVTFYNASANSCTIAITTDTLRKAGTGTTGSVTLPQYAMATALKVTTTEWVISGNGI